MSLFTRHALRSVVAALGIAGVLGGCAGPLAVTAMTGRTGQIKFGYSQIGTGHQGIISCQVGANGDAENCRHLGIVFQKNAQTEVAR